MAKAKVYEVFEQEITINETKIKTGYSRDIANQLGVTQGHITRASKDGILVQNKYLIREKEV